MGWTAHAQTVRRRRGLGITPAPLLGLPQRNEAIGQTATVLRHDGTRPGEIITQITLSLSPIAGIFPAVDAADPLPECFRSSRHRFRFPSRLPGPPEPNVRASG